MANTVFFIEPGVFHECDTEYCNKFSVKWGKVLLKQDLFFSEGFFVDEYMIVGDIYE